MMIKMLGGVSNSLIGMLTKLMGKLPGGKPGEGKMGKGMKGAPADGPAKGKPLGDQGGHLFAGVGFGTGDKHTALKNKAEHAAVSEFLKEAKAETKDGAETALREVLEGAKEEKTTQDADTERRADVGEQGETREADVRREEARDEARVQGQQDAKEQGETKETAEAKDADGQQRQDEEDEEDRPGAGWVAEEQEEQEDDEKPGLRQKELMTDNLRCRGAIEDGARCLRKAVKGMGYCREHMVNWRPERIQKV